MEGKEGSVISSIHHLPAILPDANSHKLVFVVLIVRTIQGEQTPIRLSTQGDGGFGEQTLYMIERKEEGHRRLSNVKTKAN
jgi:hypothetical protein